MNHMQEAVTRVIASETKPTTERALELRELAVAAEIEGTLPALIDGFVQAEKKAQDAKTAATDATAGARCAWHRVRKRAEDGPDLFEAAGKAVETTATVEEVQPVGDVEWPDVARTYGCPERLITEGAPLAVACEYLSAKDTLGKRQAGAFWGGVEAKFDGKPFADNPYSKSGMKQLWLCGWECGEVGPHVGITVDGVTVEQVAEMPATPGSTERVLEMLDEDTEEAARLADERDRARCHAEGVAAAKRGALGDSPYDAGGLEDEAWREGWADGQAPAEDDDKAPRGLERARQQGRRVFLSGGHLDANPYVKPDYRRAWNDGFTESMNAEEPADDTERVARDEALAAEGDDDEPNPFAVDEAATA